MIAVIDYDAGNVKNVEKALRYLGQDCIITADHDIIRSAKAIILPGVGAFGQCMENLKKAELDKLIKQLVANGKPFMGICLGMQLLYQSSEESEGIAGLGLLEGQVKRFPTDMGLKIPHIGFNSIDPVKGKLLFDGLPEHPFYYFVHSYYCNTTDRNAVAATADYGITFDCSIEFGNIFATQFHPEKSGSVGLETLNSFIKYADNIGARQ